MPMTSKEAEKLLRRAVFIEVKGGKGSHRKFVRKGYPRPVILTKHGKELSRVVEASVLKATNTKR
ncbi:type II toxin-antitoxin system HicA family toxin [Enterococcus sp. AZ072]|uniref:type II toxin-antitoxin system HicA family toxin n=1 Tax=unclassified Enterococcus TaxID=2608891 RepID=UPI003D2DEBA2